MKERPILFAAPMVRALLDGRKTQTRRMIKGDALKGGRAPYGVMGDRLWVRENYRFGRGYNGLKASEVLPPHAKVHYEADGPAPDGFGKLRPSIYLTRARSRILLEVISVRRERLLDISEEDAIAEGLKWIVPGVWSVDGASLPVASTEPRDAYFQLWDQINGAGSANKNPWVWVVHFYRVKT